MRINERGIAILKECEGLRLNAYRCPAGIWSVGYGSTKKVTEGMVINRDEAEARLVEDLALVEKQVNQLVQVPLTENEFSALVSFCYNVGATRFKSSTLLKKLNRGDLFGVAQEFHRWVYTQGRILPGLMNRRRQEQALFLSPEYPITP
jgi:lysozyme